MGTNREPNGSALLESLEPNESLCGSIEMQMELNLGNLLDELEVPNGTLNSLWISCESLVNFKFLRSF